MTKRLVAVLVGVVVALSAIIAHCGTRFDIDAVSEEEYEFWG